MCVCVCVCACACVRACVCVLGRIQRRATNLIQELRDLSYEEHLVTYCSTPGDKEVKRRFPCLPAIWVSAMDGNLVKSCYVWIK